ncbi:MAG: bifunctional 2',3'-cyclic-nucleotide 2'-phosphodiesterase/3'-nucleotidase [Paracoccaceae bacterium]
MGYRPKASSSGARAGIALRILATSDLHAHLMAHDYFADRPSDRVGLVRTASLIRAARAEAANVLLFDNGDTLQGTPLADLEAECGAVHAGAGPPHPVVGAMNRLGYDAATVGNHDFDYGIGFLQAAYGRAEFPVVATNLTLADRQGGPAFAPHALLRREATDLAGGRAVISVGVIGLVPPRTADWNHALLHGRAGFRDMGEAARDEAAQLRALGAEIVVALCHTGLARGKDRAPEEHQGLQLAKTDGIDALIFGHTHDVFPSPAFEGLPELDTRQGTVAGKPAAMPGFAGSHLAVVDLLLSPAGDGWKVTGHRAEVRPIAFEPGRGIAIAAVPDDPEVGRLARPAHLRTRDHLATTIGTLDRPLDTSFALAGDAAAIHLVADAQRWFAERALQGTPYEGLPLLSAAAPSKAGGRGGPGNYTQVPPGRLRLRHIADLCPFADRIALVTATGAELCDWLDRSASVFHTIVPGEDGQTLFDTEAPGYLFDVIDGLTYSIDLTRPPRDPLARPAGGSRIRDLRHDGRPVDEDARFVVATNSHRIAEPEFLGPGRRRVIREGPETCREILHAYVASHRQVSPRAPGTWRFMPLGGTAVTFLTSPGAVPADGALAAPEACTMDYSPEGFRRFALRL